MSRLVAQEWQARPERSNAFALRAMRWIATTLGRPTARVMLYFIAGYFLVFSRAPRRASREYLTRVFGRPPTTVEQFRHYLFFASTVLDRVYFLNERYDLLSLTVHGEDVLRSVETRAQGCVMLGAHFGSFEAIRSIGRQRPGLKVNLVMYEENAQRIGAALRQISPTLALDIIPLGRVDSMMRVRASLERGEWVGLLADRVLADDERVNVSFLGQDAGFAAGPFRLALMLRRPVVVMFGSYMGGNRYELHFEEITPDYATSHAGSVTELAQRFASHLEAHCRRAPFNWFNFYDFWR